MFECNKCYKNFTHKYLLDKHLINKTPCDKPKKIIEYLTIKIDEININLDKLYNLSLQSKKKCFYCENNFSTKQNLERHIENYCIDKKKILEDKFKYIDIIENKKNDLKIIIENNKMLKKIKRLKRERNNINIINNTINNNNNNNTINIVMNNNIQLNAFGKEDLSHLNNDDYKNYITNLLPGLIKYITDIHYSDAMPANQNICIPKLTSNIGMIYDGYKWISKDTHEIIHKLVRKNVPLLDNKLNELEENKIIDSNIYDSYNEAITLYYEKNDVKKKIEKDLILKLYDNKIKIKNYKNLLT